MLAARPAAAQTGIVAGRVTDAGTREPLPGANVSIAGTAVGAVSDIEGNYRVTGAPAGAQTLVVSYLGYVTARIPVTVTAGGTLRQNVALRYDAVEGEEVVVTAQLEGQTQAINQQLTSNTIVSVVSSDRIRELPDQNAAESVGRLPGISIQRDAGEGQKIVVRGLSPRFNSVTVNGERIPSTDPNDRSVDLSLISPDVLAAIEVYKAITPDMDADAIGGTVNLVVRRAPEGLRGNMSVQTGYNDYARSYGQYRGSFSASNRFFGNRLGLLATGSLQRATRDSDVLTGDYTFLQQTGNNPAIINVDNVNVATRAETRDRYNASVALDVRLPGNGALLLSSFIGRTDRDEVQRRKRYRVGSFTVEHDVRDRQLFTQLFNNSLGGQHPFRFAEVDWQFGHSYTLNRTPFSNYARFVETGAFRTGLPFNQGPEPVPGYARDSLEATWFQYGTFNPERTADRDLTGQLNVRVPFQAGRLLAGYLKFGGKLRDKQRTRDLDEFRTPFAEPDAIARENPGRYTLFRNTNILFENFADASFHERALLGGQYMLNVGLDPDLINAFHAEFADRYDLNRFVELSDYEAGETTTAGYLMTEVNFGRTLMLLPGIRYEQTATDYKGFFGSLRGGLGEAGTLRDTTGGQTYGEWLPMMHLRYRPLPTLNLRLAVTRTLSRPDYFNLVPFQRINDAELTVEQGNPGLAHTKAWNYDAILSWATRAGLFTAGGFYKTLKDIDYRKEGFRRSSGEFANYRVTEPTNAEKSTVYGVELDAQTNLGFLRNVLGGIVVNANYTYVHSETLFPFFYVGPRSPNPPFRPILVDTVRAGRLPGQAGDVVNLSLGYERGGFSGRVSMVYQGNSLFTVGQRAELDGYTAAFTRWDASVSQRLPSRLGGLTLFVNVNNLTDTPEGAYLGTVSYPTREEYFGWTADLGLRYSF
ncbi:MAG TPA: TonB-dependent receptor [Rhodothermales bacterium]|nr:TonB-dependent receptor [Rhodothermales bacterium]